MQSNEVARRLLDSMIEIAIALKREMSQSALEPVNEQSLLEHRGQYKEPLKKGNDIV